MKISELPKEDFKKLERVFKEDIKGDWDLEDCWGSRDFDNMYETFSKPHLKRSCPNVWAVLKLIKGRQNAS